MSSVAAFFTSSSYNFFICIIHLKIIIKRQAYNNNEQKNNSNLRFDINFDFDFDFPSILSYDITYRTIIFILALQLKITILNVCIYNWLKVIMT